MNDLIKKIADKNYDDAKVLFEERMNLIFEKKMCENKKIIGSKNFEGPTTNLEQITMTRKAFDGSPGARAEKLYRDVTEEDKLEEKYGKGYVSPEEKIRRALAKRGQEGIMSSNDKYRETMNKLNAQYEKLKEKDKKLDEQAAPQLTPSGEADAFKLRDMIRSRMQAASGGSSVGPSASSMSPKIPETSSTFKLPSAGEPSIPANAKQFSLPKAGEAPKAANVNVPKSSSNLDAISNWAEKNITPKLSKAMPIIKKVAPYATSIGKFMANPLVGAGIETMKSSPTNVGEPDYVKQNVAKQAAADKKSAEVTNKILKTPYTGKSVETSISTKGADKPRAGERPVAITAPAQKPAEIDKSSSKQANPDYTRAGERKQAVMPSPSQAPATKDKSAKVPSAKPEDMLKTSIAAAKAPYKSRSFDVSKSLGQAPKADNEPARESNRARALSGLPAPVTTTPAKAFTPPKRPVTPTPNQTKDYSDLSFPVAFSRAREEAGKSDSAEQGKYKFKWKGKEFQTNLAGKEAYVAKQKGTVSTDKGPSAYEKKLAKMTPEKAAANIKLQTPKWAGGYGNNPALQEEAELDEARIAIVKARIRGGKIQRRKKVSNVPGYTLRAGKLKRMSAMERRNRRIGQKRGKIKRRMKLSRTLVKRQRSLRKRQSLGLK